jgi:hypothetical protein
MIISIDTEKSHQQNSTSFHGTISEENRDKRNIPQPDKDDV